MDSKKKGAPPALLVLMALWALFAGHCSARSMTDFTSSLARGGTFYFAYTGFGSFEVDLWRIF
jgi:hypothetical protein